MDLLQFDALGQLLVNPLIRFFRLFLLLLLELHDIFHELDAFEGFAAISLQFFIKMPLSTVHEAFGLVFAAHELDFRNFPIHFRLIKQVIIKNIAVFRVFRSTDLHSIWHVQVEYLSLLHLVLVLNFVL